MLGKLTGWDDTIVALATPPGVGAIGVIRLSGKKSLEIANQLFPSKDLKSQVSHSLHVGYLRESERVLDEVVIGLYKAPRSYTGEDVVEISSHGSPFLLEQIIQALIRKGARLAKPGEFTQRAFLNGKLDLTQAEGVADLIASNTEAARRSALHNLRGGFRSDLKMLRDRLLSFSALVELELDFSQEDLEFADRTQLDALIREAQKTTDSLLESFRLGNVIKNGVQVAIVGKPNAGKSTLLNTLLNENRAIVSEIAGTTRDTIEEVINIGGIDFRLVDTAGIRAHSKDSIESMGVGRSLEKMKQADVVLYLFDSGTTDVPELDKVLDDLTKDKLSFIAVANKIDLDSEEKIRKSYAGFGNILFISAKENRYIETLKEKLVDMVLKGTAAIEGTIVTNIRHYEALQALSKSLYDVRKGLDEKISGDLLSLDIRRSLHNIGEITGEITGEDQLDYIFSKFCIGK
jgi:tRNA modification GTPase